MSGARWRARVISFMLDAGFGVAIPVALSRLARHGELPMTRRVAGRGRAIGMRDGYLRGALSPQATQRQMDALAAYVTAGGCVQDAAALVGIRPSTVKRHLADLRARSGLTTE